MNNVSLTEFYNMLEVFDWYWEMSDDGRTYSKGKKLQGDLLKIAEQSPKHQKLFEEFEQYYWSGTPWGTTQAPKPKKPQEDL